MPTANPNPLRLVGLARCLAGTWFVASAIASLDDLEYLLGQVTRLLHGDIGGTSAPIRSLLLLLLAAALLGLGVTMFARGLRWMRRRATGGPSPLASAEVLPVLAERRLPAYGPTPIPLPQPLRRWLEDDLGRITAWRRDLLGAAVRAVARATAIALGFVASWLIVSLAVPTEPRGPFPLGFVVFFPFVAAVWASLALLLIGSEWPRAEAIEMPVVVSVPGDEPGRVIESPPGLVGREPPGLGTAIALAGVAAQCLLPTWWSLGDLDYPHLTTTIIRHLGAIAAGILFYRLGGRMIAAGAELLRRVQYDSIVVILDPTTSGKTARAAAVRTESRDPDGERQIVSAVGGPHTREAARKLLLLH